MKPGMRIRVPKDPDGSLIGIAMQAAALSFMLGLAALAIFIGAGVALFWRVFCWPAKMLGRKA